MKVAVFVSRTGCCLTSLESGLKTIRFMLSTITQRSNASRTTVGAAPRTLGTVGMIGRQTLTVSEVRTLKGVTSSSVVGSAQVYVGCAAATMN